METMLRQQDVVLVFKPHGIGVFKRAAKGDHRGTPQRDGLLRPAGHGEQGIGERIVHIGVIAGQFGRQQPLLRIGPRVLEQAKDHGLCIFRPLPRW